MTSTINCAGKAGISNVSELENSGGSRKSSNNKVVSRMSHRQNSSTPDYHINGKKESNDYYENYLWFGPRGNGGKQLHIIYAVSSFYYKCFWMDSPLHVYSLSSPHASPPFGFLGPNNLYPGDIIPFTRRPLFLIIDSDDSHAFKAGLS